jgi:hypothetical protein
LGLINFEAFQALNIMQVPGVLRNCVCELTIPFSHQCLSKFLVCALNKSDISDVFHFFESMLGEFLYHSPQEYLHEVNTLANGLSWAI